MIDGNQAAAIDDDADREMDEDADHDDGCTQENEHDGGDEIEDIRLRRPAEMLDAQVDAAEAEHPPRITALMRPAPLPLSPKISTGGPSFFTSAGGVSFSLAK